MNESIFSDTAPLFLPCFEVVLMLFLSIVFVILIFIAVNFRQEMKYDTP